MVRRMTVRGPGLRFRWLAPKAEASITLRVNGLLHSPDSVTELHKLANLGSELLGLVCCQKLEAVHKAAEGEADDPAVVELVRKATEGLALHGGLVSDACGSTAASADEGAEFLSSLGDESPSKLSLIHI